MKMEIICFKSTHVNNNILKFALNLLFYIYSQANVFFSKL